MMVHKLTKGLKYLEKASPSLVRMRPFAPTTAEPQARRTHDHTERVCRFRSSWWFPHTRRPGNIARYPRQYIDLVPTISSPESCQYQGGRGPLHALVPFSDTASLKHKSGQWEGVQVFEEDRLRESFVSTTADTSLINRIRQRSQKYVQWLPVIPLSPTTPSLPRTRPHRRIRNTGAMPRSGYDTTNMRVAANPRPAASARQTGHARNNKSKSDGNSDGGSGSGSGNSSRGEGNGRDDDDKGSKNTAQQEPEREGEDGGLTTEELIKTINHVRLPLEGRGWTFWL